MLICLLPRFLFLTLFFFFFFNDTATTEIYTLSLHDALPILGLLWTLPYPLSVSSLTARGVSFDWGPVIGGYLGLLLLASSFLALGLWASAVSRNQIVGFIVGLLLCFAFYFVDKFALVLPSSLAEVLQFLSVDYHFENIARGVFDTRDVLFYLSLTTAGLMLTTRSLAAARQ